MSNNKSLENLKILFQDRPEVLRLLDFRELDESNLTDQQLAKELKKRKLYSEPVNFYATGRTGSGKTSLGNSLLDAGQTAMESHGHIDCTDVVQYFSMASNLRYFDLPGAGSDENFENINRAALLLSQIEEKYGNMTPINEFIVRDFSKYPATKKPEDEKVTVLQWQSSNNQELVAADIILYVVAPHNQFIRADRDYLGDLLTSQKERFNTNKVIFALNIHHHPDGKIKPTHQNIEDAETKITEIYQQFYSGIPPIVKIDALKGTGINQITELICEILPSEKIGNMQQVLRDKLKQFAKKERSRRYRQALIYIASRLATYKVDENFGTKSLLQEACTAVCDYGIRIFQEEDVLAEAEKELYEMVDSLATEAKVSREEAVKILVKDVEEKEVTTEKVTGYKPIYKDKEIKEKVPDYHEKNKQGKRSLPVRASLGVLEGITRGLASPISALQKIQGKNEEEILDEKIHKEFNKRAHRNEKVIKRGTKKIKRIERVLIEIKEQKEKVTEKVPFVVEKEQEVGKKYLQGGYPVVENLLAIGLGIEKADPSKNLNTIFEDVVEDGRREVTGLLARYKDKINQLAISSDPEQAEENIIKILEKTLFIEKSF